jgi:hypothetical protein
MKMEAIHSSELGYLPGDLGYIVSKPKGLPSERSPSWKPENL